MKKLISLLILIFTFTTYAEFSDFFVKWDTLLIKYSSPSKRDNINTVVVNYKELQTDNLYRELISDIKLFDPGKLETQKEKLAYWINIYNIGSAKMITDNYPVKSIRKLGSLFKSVWKKDILKINDKDYNLLEIENDILRKMNDERVHFAINCASISCPNLRSESYVPDKIDRQLNEQKTLFLTDSTKGFADKGKVVYISKIFNWFSEDFSNGNLHNYLNISKSTKIKYLKYNWNVNE